MMRTNGLKALAALTALTVSGVAHAQVAPENISVATNFAFESEYSFRGAKLDGASLQPSVDIGVADAYIGTWTSMPLNRDNAGSEVDIYGGYVFDLGEAADLDVGYTYYWYPDDGGSDREPYVGVSFDAAFDPAVYVFYETQNEILTVEGSAGYSYDLSETGFEGYALDLGAYLGYVTDDDDDYAYYGFTADVVYALSEAVGFSVGARLAGNSDEDLVGGPQQQLWWGTAVSVAY